METNVYQDVTNQGQHITAIIQQNNALACVLTILILILMLLRKNVFTIAQFHSIKMIYQTLQIKDVWATVWVQIGETIQQDMELVLLFALKILLCLEIPLKDLEFVWKYVVMACLEIKIQMDSGNV